MQIIKLNKNLLNLNVQTKFQISKQISKHKLFTEVFIISLKIYKIRNFYGNN
jgi:hypothetical protein